MVALWSINDFDFFNLINQITSISFYSNSEIFRFVTRQYLIGQKILRFDLVQHVIDLVESSTRRSAYETLRFQS